MRETITDEVFEYCIVDKIVEEKIDNNNYIPETNNDVDSVSGFVASGPATHFNAGGSTQTKFITYMLK